MNILIVKLSAIGDVIHTLPALNAIRKHYPRAHITWLVEEDAYPLLEGHAALDRILVSKRKRWLKNPRNLSLINSIKEAYQFIKELRDAEYDLIIDFQALLKSGVLIGLSKGKKKIGFDKGMEHMEHSYLFLNERVPSVNMNNHAILRSMMLLKSLGIHSNEIVYNLPISDQDRMRAEDLMEQHGVKESRPLVAINPLAKWNTKLWNNRKFGRLADILIERYGAGVVFTGSREDRKTIQEIIDGMELKAANFAGKTGLKILAALYEKADFLISTDTGPMHLAAAVNTPVVALFGPTAPWRTGPFGPGHRIIQAGLDCSPCFKRKCETTDCMKEISVEKVLKSALKIIGKL
ncbi:lipopolysaccharide heptosyltransferase II [Thermodesulfobacteriota bacterium]